MCLRLIKFDPEKIKVIIIIRSKHQSKTSIFFFFRGKPYIDHVQGQCMHNGEGLIFDLRIPLKSRNPHILLRVFWCRVMNSLRSQTDIHAWNIFLIDIQTFSQMSVFWNDMNHIGLVLVTFITCWYNDLNQQNVSEGFHLCKLPCEIIAQSNDASSLNFNVFSQVLKVER